MSSIAGIEGAQARAAMATSMLFIRNQVTVQQIMEVTGIRTRRGAQYLIDNISYSIPIYEVQPGVYSLNRTNLRNLFD